MSRWEDSPYGALEKREFSLAEYVNMLNNSSHRAAKEYCALLRQSERRRFMMKAEQSCNLDMLADIEKLKQENKRLLGEKKVFLKGLDEIQLLPSKSSKKRFVFDYAYIARKAIIEAGQALKEEEVDESELASLRQQLTDEKFTVKQQHKKIVKLRKQLTKANSLKEYAIESNRINAERAEKAEADLVSFLQTLEVRAEDNRFLRQENKRLTLIADVLDSHQVACRRKDCSVCYHYRQALNKEK